jgi:hypothetical protein
MCRNIRGGTFYCVDTLTRKRQSLKTTSEADAQRIVHAKNEALRTPQVILHALLSAGPLFPMISTWKESDRAKAFIRRCRRVEVSGVEIPINDFTRLTHRCHEEMNRFIHLILRCSRLLKDEITLMNENNARDLLTFSCF